MMEKYVDGFLIPISIDKVEEYRKLAQKAGAIWKEYGALEYYECIGDDLTHENAFVSFEKSAGVSENETVIFAWIVYESKEQRDRINAAVMEDERMKAEMKKGEEPFDFKRMVYGGFKTLVTIE